MPRVTLLIDMPSCRASATTASFSSVKNRRRRATPVITSTFENVLEISVCPGLSLGTSASPGVRSRWSALQGHFSARRDLGDKEFVGEIGRELTL